MSLKAPNDFELDESEQRLNGRSDDEHEDAYTDLSDTSHISELDPLKPPTQNGHSNGDLHDEQSYAWLGHKRRRDNWLAICVPTRFSCALLALFTVTLVLLLGAGGLWASRRKAPTIAEGEDSHEEYGLSEAWYPTPAGGQDAAWQESYRKAADLVKQMTLPEKVNITTGTGWSMGMCVGTTGPVDRLGFPSLCLQDGPLGLRFVSNITAFPAGITVGATWNKRLMYLRGEALGFEARMKGVNVLLGPAMGPIGRLPAGGRNWEGFGSDPVLQGIAAAETIKGIQSQGVIATAKHWVGNEQEHFRQVGEWNTPDAISSNIDDRALHEIYAWPFADSVRAGVGSVMCSYNKLNSSYACQNSKILNGVLKDEIGFQGFVQSDWLAQRSGVASALSGLDMSMPGDGLIWQDGDSLWGKELSKAVLNTSVPIDRFNDMVLRVVAAWYQMGQDNETTWPSAADGGGPNFSSWTDDKEGELHPGSPNSTDYGIVNKNVPVRITEEGGDHDGLVRRIAAEGIVLVKNEDGVLPFKRDGSNIRRSRSQGKVKIGVFGEDAYLNPAGINDCEDRACNEGTLASGWGSGAVEFPYLSEPISAIKSALDGEHVELSGAPFNEVSDISDLASQQDLCLVFINADAGEGFRSWEDVHGDRNNLHAQKDGDELVQIISKSCGGNGRGDTVVILHTVGPVILEKWIGQSSVKAVLIAHLPGQESGNALADVLFGYINPSGRLPYTIAKHEDDYGPDSKILTESKEPTPQQDFSEGLYIDYRYFDKHDISPRFEFGYGLSYTTFELSDVYLNGTGVNGTVPRKRKYYDIKPPRLGYNIPDAAEAVWPEGARRLSKYIYPYIESAKDIVVGKYPWPRGYEEWHAPSAAGGGPGGNPDLYTTILKLGVTVRNTGSVAGDSVIQVYVSMPTDVKDTFGEPVDVPVRVLRGFEKRSLGTSKDDSKNALVFELTRRDLSYWDVKVQNWLMPYGKFKICAGFSSRDLPECRSWEHKVYHPAMNTSSSITFSSSAATTTGTITGFTATSSTTTTSTVAKHRRGLLHLGLHAGRHHEA